MFFFFTIVILFYILEKNVSFFSDEILFVFAKTNKNVSNFCMFFSTNEQKSEMLDEKTMFFIKKQSKKGAKKDNW